jgi:hypothetical protein
MGHRYFDSLAMLSPRKVFFLAILLAVAAVLGAVAYRIAQLPRTVRMLPDGDFLGYANWSVAHTFGPGKDLEKTLTGSDPGYQDFVAQTGVQFYRDLDTVAISSTNTGLENTESAVIFTGRMDQARLVGYLQKISNSVDKYRDKSIYSIPHGIAPIRVCMLDDRTVSLTQGQSSAAMHSMIDRSLTSALAHAPSSLVDSYYRYVPFASVGWAILRTHSPVSANPPAGQGYADFLRNAAFVASLRYFGSFRLKLEVFSESEADAKRVKETANQFLTSMAQTGADNKNTKAFLDTLRIQQSGTRTVITVTVPPSVVKELANSR